MPPRMLLRQNIHSAKKGEMRARFSLRFLLSFVFPVVPPINSLSLDPSRANVYDEEKHRHRETTRDSIKPRLKYQEQHALSLSRDVHARGERERHTRETRREHKAHLVTQSMRVFPQRTNALFSIERTSLSVRI